MRTTTKLNCYNFEIVPSFGKLKNVVKLFQLFLLQRKQFKILEILEIFDPLLAQILLVIAILDQRFLALVLRPGQCLQYLQLFHHLNLQYYYSIATIQHQNQFLAAPSTYPCQWVSGWVSD